MSAGAALHPIAAPGAKDLGHAGRPTTLQQRVEVGLAARRVGSAVALVVEIGGQDCLRQVLVADRAQEAAARQGAPEVAPKLVEAG